MGDDRVDLVEVRDGPADVVFVGASSRTRHGSAPAAESDGPYRTSLWARVPTRSGQNRMQVAESRLHLQPLEDDQSPRLGN